MSCHLHMYFTEFLWFCFVSLSASIKVTLQNLLPWLTVLHNQACDFVSHQSVLNDFNYYLVIQASNMMRCDNCGGKHKRVPVERPWYSARFCDRCSIRHSAKEVRSCKSVGWKSLVTRIPSCG